MPPFPLVPLHATPRLCTIVVEVGSHAENASRLRAIVAGEHDDRVLVQPGAHKGFRAIARR